MTKNASTASTASANNAASTVRTAPKGTPQKTRSLPMREELALVLPELRARAMKLTRDPVASDDLVQDTVVRALSFEKQFIQGTNVRAWLGTVLFSVFVSRYRRKKREQRAAIALAADPHAWTTPQGFTAPDCGSLAPATKVKVATLPPAFRDVVCLVDLEERSYRDAATELGVPVGTVMSRLHRGRRLLAESLEGASAQKHAA
jgi:RNA polymerase sigma-70 factor (ECF subfamily)